MERSCGQRQRGVLGKAWGPKTAATLSSAANWSRNPKRIMKLPCASVFLNSTPKKGTACLLRFTPTPKFIFWVHLHLSQGKSGHYGSLPPYLFLREGWKSTCDASWNSGKSRGALVRGVGRGCRAMVLGTPSWASVVNSALTNNRRDIKGPHTFLFGRVPGLWGDTQTPSETNYNLRATSETE